MAGCAFYGGVDSGRYECYREEPNLKITKYFWVESEVHVMFIVGAAVQSGCNVWIGKSESGLTYRHAYLIISVLILVLHAVFMCIDYYATEKAAVIRYCKRIKKKKSADGE